ncbi:MAG TPA: PKD domain-containing protein [Saprospiraceae bacterium]|nr:PKD domain-containing protein [Saprospiraceae bacterium]
MQSRFLPAFILAFLFSFNLFGQNQDTILIDGIVGPTCGCDGFIDISVSSSSPSQPPGFFFYQWSNGNTTQDLFNLCAGTYCVTVTNGNAMGNTAVKCFQVQNINFDPLQIISSNPAPCNFDSSGIFNDCEKACPGTTITYSVSFPNIGGTGGTNGPVFSWAVSGASSWTVSNNNNGNHAESSVTVTWSTPGLGSVSVFMDGASGCNGEDALCVTIIDEPKADFTTNPAAAIAGGPLQVCLGQTVHFTNQSTGDADYFEWLFSDDQTTTAAENPDHIYLTPGTHTVRLVAYSSCLCSDTTTMTIEVLNAQAPSLACVSTVCSGATVTYTASNVCAPFNWAVSSEGTILNGGTALADSITIQWNNGPSGTITLSGMPCSGAACPVAGVIEVPVIAGNAQIEGQERVCPGATEVYTIEPYGGTGFVWTLPTGGTIIDGQGTNRVTVEWNSIPNPAPAADHTLYVQYNNCYLGCGGSDLIHVRILSAFRIEGPLEACENSNASFSAKLNFNNAGLACNWTLYGPSGNVAWISPVATISPNVPFLNGPGTYRLFAYPADQNATCSEEADWVILVPAQPVKPTGIDGETNICPGTAYAYEATGLPAGANVRWTIQNGAGPTTTQVGNPLVLQWAANGPYWLTATHVSSDGLGCLSDTSGLVMQAISLPVISGTPQVCEDDKGTYSIPNLQNVAIIWSTNPAQAGAVANGQGTNASEIFWTLPGNHLVNVQVCGLNAQFPVTVNQLPDPVVLHPAGLCPGSTATIQTASGYVTYVWKNENGSVAGSNATIDLGPGIYSVEVTDANGCIGSKEFLIDTWDVPDVSLTTSDPTGFCNNSYTVSLTALTNTDGNYTYQWFRDNNPIGGASGSVHFSNQYGLYTVQVTNSNGCTSTAGPILLFEYCDPSGGGGSCTLGSGPLCPSGVVQCVPDPTPRCDSFVIVLNDYSGMYVPGTAEWTTGISGGAVLGTSTAEQPSFIYSNAGKYIVAVRVQLSDGTFCTALDSIDVEAVARFDQLPGCPGFSSEFENRSELLPEAGISQYAWNFGDPASGANNNSALEDPLHVYNPAGIYDVTLTITATSGCTSSVTHSIEIPESDPPSFADPLAKCAGNALEFLATANPDILSIDWDFGDPASGAANEASGNTVYHNYIPGTYTVTATSNNVYGCTATFTRSVTVVPPSMSGNISPANPGPICEGSSITLTAPAGAVSYEWSDDSHSTTQAITVNEEGSYKVTLTDANGCTYVPPAVNVDVRPAPDAVIKALLFNELGQAIGTEFPQVTLCFGEDVALQAYTNGSANYSWSGGNGSNSIIFFTDDRNTLLPVGNHLYSVTVTNQATGCTAVSDPFLITVNPLPSGFSIASPTFCAGDPNVVTYTGPTPANWQFFWSTGASGTTLTTEDPGAYYIRVINEFGCEAKSNVVTILPGPQVVNIPAGCHTRCSPDTLCLPNIPNIATWQWYLDGNPIPGANSPNFIAQQSGTYWAALTDIFGCSAESAPLDLTLYTGFGNITGNVWSDVNGNGMIDPADTLLPGITVVVFQNGALYGVSQSDFEGDFTLTNVLSTQYSFNVDQFSLPPNWHVVIGQDQLTLSGCDVSGTVDFLLDFGCQAFGTLQLYACPGGFATYNGNNISVGGSQSFQFTSPGGCDSTLVVSVAPYPTSSSNLTLQTCPGTTANYNGSTLAIGATQTFTFANWLGCDSLVTVNVTALPTSGSNVSLQACPGSTAIYQGNNIPVGATQTFTFPNWQGCDSVVTVSVTALSTSSSNVSLQACPGGNAIYQGNNLPVGSTQSFTFPNWQGCDSVVTVSVTALPTSSNSITLHTCPNGSVVYQGVALNAGASQSFTLTNFVGCDSVVSVQVIGDLPTSTNSITAGVCPGEVFNYQGVSLVAGASQTFTLTNFAGCDSLVTVTVFQKNASSEVLEVTVCPGETYTYQGVSMAIGESKEFHFVNQEQCDSSVTIFVKSFPATSFSVQSAASCANAASGIITLSGPSGGPEPFRYSLDKLSYQVDSLFEDLPSGAYTVYVEDGNGCITGQPVNIPQIPALEVNLANGILPCDSAGVALQPSIAGGNGSNLEYLWWNGAETSFSEATEAGAVWVEVSNECETVRSEAVVSWADLAEDIDIVYVPNVFMPNARDSENTQFKPYFSAGVRLIGFTFAVFDRWGNMLFQTSNTSDAWNGVFRSKEHNPGVQAWYLEADVAICGRILHVVRKGDVTIVR